MEYKKFSINDDEFVKLKELMYKNTGVFLKDTKKILVMTRLQSRLMELNIDTFNHYYDLIQKDKNELGYFINAITTNETYFFRNDKHFEFIKGVIIKDYNDQKKEKSIKIWSAACSTGEEPYSIYIFLLENLPTPSIWNMNIYASDINTEVINSAKNAVYNQERLRMTPKNIIDKYFDKSNDKRGNPLFNLKEQYKTKIKFKQHNLKDPFMEREFDIIFLRNVMIYFDQPMKNLVISNMSKVLKPGGYLFLGHSESLIGIKSNFEYVQPSIFKLRSDRSE